MITTAMATGAPAGSAPTSRATTSTTPTSATPTSSATTAAPSVSVILPMHRTGAEAEQCLEALGRLDPPPAELVIAVDGADPAVIELARPYATRLLPLVDQGGPARARNAGAEGAIGDVLLFIDADVVVPVDIVRHVADYLRDHPEVDAIIGSYDDEPGATNFLSQYKNLMNHYTHQRSNTEGYTFWGACGAMRREVFAALGGFDETYREPSVEDIELGYRLVASGRRVHVVPELQVKHLKRWNARSLVRTDILGRAVPWSELILRGEGFQNDLNIDRAGRAKVVAAGGVLLGALTARHRVGGVLALASAAALLALDAPLLRFYRDQRGAAFAAAAVPWLWASHLYSGGSFAYALARRTVRR